MPTGRTLVRFGVFELDVRAEELRKQGVKVRLRGQPIKILRLLLDRPNQVVTRGELHRALWDDTTFVEFDVGLNAAVKRLRRALGDTAAVPRFIETLPGVGYRFLAPVDVESSTSISEAASIAVPARPSSRSLHITGIVALILVAAALSWFVAARGPGKPDAIRSLAVLPLSNLSSDAELGFLAEGMADALTTELGIIHGLRLVSRTSTLRYQGTKQSIPEIARELGVDALVEGSILRTNDRVRITIQLIDARSDAHLWAESYEKTLDDLTTLQQEVAIAIVREIGVALTPEETRRLARRSQLDSRAFQAYLKGRYFWQQRTEAGLTRAMSYFEDAIKIDPKYAAAYAGLADAYGLIPRYGTVPAQTALLKSKEYALKAIELDDAFAEAYTALAKVQYTLDWNWTAAADGFKRAIELNPGYATAYHWYSLYLLNVGRVDQAVAISQKARELDPLSFPVQAHAAWVLYLAGEVDRAEHDIRSGLELAPNHASGPALLGWIALHRKQFDASIAAFESALQLTNRDARDLASLACANAAAGRRDEANVILAELMRRREREPVPTEAFVKTYAALGELDRAFEWLERSADDRSISFYIFDLRLDPLYHRMRADDRLAALFKGMGLDLSTGGA